MPGSRVTLTTPRSRRANASTPPASSTMAMMATGTSEAQSY
jgi:hypothetical protein